MQPVAILRVAAQHGIKKSLLYGFGHLSAPAIANRRIVQFAYWRHLGCRAGEKGFVRSKQVVEPDYSDLDLIAEIARKLDYRIARDTEQNRRMLIIGQQAAIAHNEQILARPFGHVAALVKQQRLVVT